MADETSWKPFTWDGGLSDGNKLAHELFRSFDKFLIKHVTRIARGQFREIAQKQFYFPEIIVSSVQFGEKSD
jgi:hypothetical protein